MKKNLKSIVWVLVAIAAGSTFILSSCSNEPEVKYVFYFIGDGMGVNQVNGTEMYQGERQGRIGTEPLCFASFPYATIATTFSATNGVTDSSAGGTALATGRKTYNGAIGVDLDTATIHSIAWQAKQSGRKVGIATSVSIDHATPAAFYAHQASRKMYYEIATDLPEAGFDFYAGAGFLQPTSKKDSTATPIFQLFDQAGYTVAKGYDEFQQKAGQAERMILMQTEGKNPSSLPYAIDREEGDLTLAQITESAIRFLTQGEDKGFFLMVEGGKIDWACHGNDAATVFQEVTDMDQAIRVAYDFYLKHPQETLIVVTADHETGGIVLGKGPYELNLQALAHQKASQEKLSALIRNLRAETNGRATWADIQGLLKSTMGFGEAITLTPDQEARLRKAYDDSFGPDGAQLVASEYANNEPVAAVAKEIINEIALVGWVSGGHSDGYVPVFAIGVGAEQFQGRMDNTEIPQRIARIARY